MLATIRTVAIGILIAAVLLVWILVVSGEAVPHPVMLAAAAGGVAVATGSVADLVRTIRSSVRLDRSGLATDATIVKVREQHVAIPSGYTGWVTAIDVSFLDASGAEVQAGFTDHARAGDRAPGQMIGILYDPERPTAVRPAAGSDPRIVDAVWLGFGLVAILVISVHLVVRGLT